MSLVFYPHSDDLQRGNLDEKLEALMEAAERYKAVVTEAQQSASSDLNKPMSPRDIKAAYNWEELTRVLRQIRELPEAEKNDKIAKSQYLTKLVEIYEVLRAAKMAKLEAVRLALVSEASQLRS